MREGINHWKYSKLDLSPILYKEPASEDTSLYNQETQDHGISEVLDWQLLKIAQAAIDNKQRVSRQF